MHPVETCHTSIVQLVPEHFDLHTLGIILEMIKTSSKIERIMPIDTPDV